jgi:hypothetical protein
MSSSVLYLIFYSGVHVLWRKHIKKSPNLGSPLDPATANAWGRLTLATHTVTQRTF